MVELGWTLSSEEHPPNRLVETARLAEDAGFGFAMVSDHYHPWIDRQGQSPFVWSVIGGVAHATERIPLGTGVTCPTMRVHPAIVAQAAATSAAMLPGRFFLGVGSGENLNEHVVAPRWPSAAIRLDMLEEAIEIIRELWEGKLVSHRGTHFEVENARLYTLPDQPPPIYVAGTGDTSASLAANRGDGLIGTAPKKELIQSYRDAGGDGPRYGQLHVCWGEREDQARKTALEVWPNVAIPGELSQELPLPRHFEEAAQTITEDMVAELVPCGPDPEKHLAQLRKFVDAGYDHVLVHQIGDDQEQAVDFYRREIMPRLDQLGGGAG
ncbi:MAG TPA: TIGR03557 family F420-dependent LLM class oxidoreductase [Actinomycetes bacterium]